jgi:beta-glucosidase
MSSHRFDFMLRYFAAALALAALSSGAPLYAAKPAHTAVTPAPRTDDWWTKMHDGFNERAKKGDVELVFLGDSITQGWADNDTWKKYYGPRHAANFGIGGDRTQHVLWRLEHGNFDGIKPKLVVLMIGTNNSNGADNTAAEIADGIKAIVAQLREKLPDTKVLLLGIFPRGEKPNPQREKNAQASELASKIADDKHVFYLDIGPKFLTADGTLTKEVMPDYLHLSPQGYEIWAEAIEPKVKELLGEKG